MVVSFARFDRIRMPSENGQPDDDMTKDFTSEAHEKLRRFSSEELMVRNLKRIVRPTTLICVSNIPSNTSGNDVRDLFQTSGLKVEDMFSQNIGKKNSARLMCYIQMKSVGDSMKAIMQISGQMVEKDKKGQEGVGLRIGFNPSTLEEEKTKSTGGARKEIVPNDQKSAN
jgi:hypothetical protein